VMRMVSSTKIDIRRNALRLLRPTALVKQGVYPGDWAGGDEDGFIYED
jgi:hypothetical protein